MNKEHLPRDLSFCAATERNKVPILEALQGRMPARGRLLEVGAGSGQHAVFMASAFPDLEWLATEQAVNLPALQSRLLAEGGDNILPAQALDVANDAWPAGGFTAAYSANTAHIMGWPAVCAMLDGIGRCLVDGGVFFLYGPFKVGGRFTTPSNQAFDQDLRARKPDMGLRDVSALENEAGNRHLKLEERLDMPANNFLLVFRKQD